MGKGTMKKVISFNLKRLIQKNGFIKSSGEENLNHFGLTHGFSRDRLSTWTRLNNTTLPSAKYMLKLANALNVTVEQFYLPIKDTKPNNSVTLTSCKDGTSILNISACLPTPIAEEILKLASNHMATS